MVGAIIIVAHVQNVAFFTGNVTVARIATTKSTTIPNKSLVKIVELG